jgi:hypothetical protein
MPTPRRPRLWQHDVGTFLLVIEQLDDDWCVVRFSGRRYVAAIRVLGRLAVAGKITLADACACEDLIVGVAIEVDQQAQQVRIAGDNTFQADLDGLAEQIGDDEKWK